MNNKRSTLAEKVHNETPLGQIVKQEQTKAALPPSRQGKKALAAYFDPAVIAQLKTIAAEEGKTNQELIAIGLNHVFRTYNKPEIA